MGKRTKIGIAIFLLVILLIPLKRNVFSFIKEQPLNGKYKLVKEPDLDLNSWFEGEYQDEFNNYFENNFGFRNFFVRLNNQIKYSLFKKTNAYDIEIGKENHLYEGGYIRDYMGYSFIGEDKIVKKISVLKKIQDELKKEDVNLMIAFAPGKASYYPEFFPAKYDTSKKTLSNYLCFTQKAKELGLDYIDFNKMFMNQKKHSEIPLYSHGGVHWGEYGVGIALDSLSKYIGQKHNINMANIELKGIVYYDSLQSADKDANYLMNLLVEPGDYYKMPTPTWKVKKTENTVKPRLLIIGDSYASRFLSLPLVGQLFSNVELWYYNHDSQFWYYNRDNSKTKKIIDVEQLPFVYRGTHLIKDLNVKEEMKRFDIVLLMSTETNLYKFDFGFADSYYNQANDKNKEARNRNEMDRFWLQKIKKEAKEKGVGLKKALYENGGKW